jgi:endonuclease YncB( thermonuclease family)
MADVLRGRVSRVIDGDTFEISNVTANSSSGNRYRTMEIIRIADIDAPELNTGAGRRPKEALERRLLGRIVACVVSSRDTYGRVVASVRIE